MQRRTPAEGGALGSLADSQPTAPHRVDKAILALRIAYEKAKAGAVEENALLELEVAVGIVWVAGDRIGDEVVATALGGWLVLLSVAKRFRRTQRWGFTGPEMGVINDMIDLYEQLLRLSSPNQLVADFQEWQRRIYAGEVPAG